MTMSLVRKCVFALLLIAAAANASIKTWTGAVNKRWSVPGNWSGGVVPVPGDSLVFQGANTDMLNDIPGVLPIESISFAGATDYFLDGNGVALTNGLSAPCCGIGFLTIKLPITLAASQTFSGKAIFYFAGPIDLNGFALTLETSNANITGSLNGSGSVMVHDLKSGAYFPGTSTFTGTMTVSGQMAFTGTITNTQIAAQDADFIAVGTLAAAALHNSRLRVGNVNGIPGGYVGPNTLSTGDLFIDRGRVSILLSPIPIVVRGTVTLANPELSVEAAPPAAKAGDLFVVIDNDGTDPVIGTFLNLPEGAVFNVGSTPFRISYIGGTGNDVVLTVVNAAIPTLDHRALLLLAAVVAFVAMRAISTMR